MATNYIKDAHLELVLGYEKLFCSLGYSYTKFKCLHGKYKIDQTTYVPANSKARTFFVKYNKRLITCAIIITPINDIYLTYKNENIIEIRKILVYSSIKKIITALNKHGNLNGF